MEIVLLIPKDRKSDVEEILKTEPFDRQSQAFKEPKGLGFEDEGIYLHFSGNDEVVKDLAKRLDFAKKPKKEKEILEAIKAEEGAVSAAIGLFD